jgi:hypothetical protein
MCRPLGRLPETVAATRATLAHCCPAAGDFFMSLWPTPASNDHAGAQSDSIAPTVIPAPAKAMRTQKYTSSRVIQKIFGMLVPRPRIAGHFPRAGLSDI